MTRMPVMMEEEEERDEGRRNSIKDKSSGGYGKGDGQLSPSSSLAALLEPFSGKRIPSTSRAGADVSQQRTANEIGLLDTWKYLPFLAHQATSLASAFVSHHVFGPPKKSWGIELTLFTTAIRESVQYSHLSNLSMLRRFLNLGQILPTPRDGVVTPVTFAVKRRGLRGLLSELDAREDGRREITAEWVVSKRIWRRMQNEHYGRQAGQNSQTHQQHISKDKVILYLHGGAYYVMSAATHRFLTISVSKYTDCRIFAINYRLAPECQFPGQLHDAVSGYFRLLNDLKIPAENIVFAGDSAGGGLCLATMMYLRDNGYPLPSGAIVMSPWVDLTMSCDSWETNAPYDYLRMPSGDDHMNPIASYLGAANVKSLITHPYVSPLFGDFTGLPPLLIQCGDAECLRDEGTLLAHKASLAGVQVYHEVYEDCPHVFQAFFFLEAAKKAHRSCRHFVKRVLPTARRSTDMDASPMDQEVMSDAHAINQDGEPDKEQLPSTPTPENADMHELDGKDPDDDVEEGDEGRRDQARAEREVAGNAIAKGLGGAIHLAGKMSYSHGYDLERVSEEERSDEEARSAAPASRKSRSAPSSPAALKSRQRSLSQLSLSSLANTLSPFSQQRSHSISNGAGNTLGLTSSDSSSAPSMQAARPGLFRTNSRPRARSGSHPDLQALLSSYDAQPEKAHTVLWRTDSHPALPLNGTDTDGPEERSESE